MAKETRGKERAMDRGGEKRKKGRGWAGGGKEMDG